MSQSGSASALPHYSLHIGGQWCEGSAGRRLDAINPYTGRAWATLAQAEVDDVNKAIAMARDTFDRTWSRVNGYERGRMMMKLADLLQADAERMGRLESTDNGKIIRETQVQMVMAARQYRFFAGYADKLWGQQIPLDQRDVFDYATREPLGVVALITAWNSPMGLLANKLAPALATGNCVVIKPSEHASVTTLEFCKFVEAAGFPPGVVNVVCGAAEVGRALVEGGVAKVSFTGSPNVGREIAAAAGRRLVPVTLELGGKSPNIIFEDANLEQARRRCVGRHLRCDRSDLRCRIAAARAAQRSRSHRAERWRSAHEPCGSAIRWIQRRTWVPRRTNRSSAAFSVSWSVLEPKVRASSPVAVRLEGPGLEHGFFVEPTVLADVRNEMEIAQEEVFGPVLAVIPFDDEDEAIRIANATRYGLAAGVWTENLSRALRVTRALQAGQVWVNTYRALAVQTPFGGFKESGFGREKGQQALDEFLASKNVMIDFSNVQRDPFAMRT